MAINWDEVRKKAQARGQKNEAQMAKIISTPSLPKAPPKQPAKEVKPPAPSIPMRTVNTPRGQQTLPTNDRQRYIDTTRQGTAQAIQDNAGARAFHGFQDAWTPLNIRDDFAKQYGQETVDTLEKSKAFRVGQGLGVMAQFALPYAGAAPKIGKALSSVPKYAKLGKLGQGIARSVATDLAVGVPLNVNYALNKEGLRGEDALKNIGVNTAIDLVAGGILEAVPVILKSGKKVASKKAFDNLPASEKAEVMTELERLAYESNVRKGKITPQGDTPKLLNEGVNWSEGSYQQAFNDWRKRNFGGAFGQMPEGDMQALKELYQESTGIDIDKVMGTPHEVPKAPETPIKTRAQAIEELQKQIAPEKLVRGDEVIGLSRGNKGTIAKQNEDGSFLVLFHNKETGKQALIKMRRNEFEPIDRTISSLSDPIQRQIDKLSGMTDEQYKAYMEDLNRPPQPDNTAQVETPKTITPGKLPRASQSKPLQGELPRAGIPVQGSTSPVQPRNIESGVYVPNEQAFAKNARKHEAPKRDNFNQEFNTRFDQEYNEFMSGMSDIPDVQTGVGDFAKSISEKGVTRSKNMRRNAEAAFRKSPEGLRWWKETFEDNFFKSTGQMSRQAIKRSDELFDNVVKKLGIRKGTKEDAAIQWFGEGKKQVKVDKVTELRDYTLSDLKADFDYTMPNGKKAWENIVKAETQIRNMYVEYIDRINDSLRKIYPNVENNVAKLQARLARTTDPNARVAIQKEIDRAIVGKRLIPRKDYFRHFQEQNNNFLVGLDNVIRGATNIDPKLVGISEMTQPKSKWTGFLQHRQGGVYTESGLGGILEYIPQAEYKIYVEPNIPTLRGMIKDLKETTTGNANAFIDELMQFTNDLAGKSNKWDRNFIDFFGDVRGRKVLNTLSTLSNRMRANAVMGNINTMIAQVFNMPNVVGYAKNPIDLADGFTQALKAGLGDPQAKAVLAKSDFLTQRYMDRSFRRFDESMASNVNKLFSWMMEYGDKVVADGAWMTFYRQGLKQGMPDAQAIRFADEFVEKSIAGRGIGEMPLSQKAKITKLFTPFQVEVRNAINVLKDLGANKDIIGIFGGVFVTSFVMNEILETTTGREIGLNPYGMILDAIQEDSPESIPTRLLGNTISNLPGGSYIAQAGKDYFGISDYKMAELFGQEDPSRFGTGNIALQTLGAPIGQAIKGQNIDLLKPATATLPKFGGKQIERTIRGLQDMAVLPREQINLQEGVSVEKQDFPASFSQSGRLRFALEPSVKNYIMAPALGSWSTKEGKAYVEGGNKALGEKQTQGVKDLVKSGLGGVQSEEIVREMPKGVDAQREYIMSLPINGKQKNIAGKLVGSTKEVNYSSETDYEFSMLPKEAKQKYLMMAQAGISKSEFTNIAKAVQSAGSTDLEKAFAISEITDNPKAFEAYGINTQAKEGYVPIQQKVAQLKQANISTNDYITAKQGSDINGSGSISKAEAWDYLDSRADLTKEQKFAMMQALVPNLKTTNNPYY